MSAVPSFPVWKGGHDNRRAEVLLLSQMSIGQGDILANAASKRQAQHASFIDALDEPSTQVMGADANASEPTALYTFLVGSQGHPFHRHDGHRVFTAVSGSGGTTIRFSFVPDESLLSSPENFLRYASQIEIPPDCLFSVRFGRGVWHQFTPSRPGHPALFALSCHTEEVEEARRGGLETEQATIAALTHVLPQSVIELLTPTAWTQVHTTHLSLDAAPHSLAAKACRFVRDKAGPILKRWPGRRIGFATEKLPGAAIAVSSDNMVPQALPGAQHIDAYAVRLEGEHNPTLLMGSLLLGFVSAPPLSATRWMKVRNVFAKPFKLRTSPLCCPVSSLLSQERDLCFNGLPVLQSQVDQDRCRVMLGADDWHLSFRTQIEVLSGPMGTQVSMTSGVRTKGLFGSIYLWLITPVHKHQVTPALLDSATRFALSMPATTLRHPSAGLPVLR